jgi:hypothetical protein
MNDLILSEDLTSIKDLIKEGENGLILISDFEQTKNKLIEISEPYKGMVVTKENFDEAKKARLLLRTTRTSLDKLEKHNTKVFNSMKDEKKAEIAKLIEITEPVESAIDAQIKSIEEEKKRLKQIAEKQEADRIKKIEDTLSMFRESLTNIYLKVKAGDAELGMLTRRLEDLKAENFEERAFDGEKLYVEFETKLPELREHLDKKKKEAEELAELRKKQEADRIAKEEQDKKDKEERDRLNQEKIDLAKRSEEIKKQEEAVELTRRKLILNSIGFVDDEKSQQMSTEYMNIDYKRIKSHTVEEFDKKVEELKYLKTQYEKKIKDDEERDKKRKQIMEERENELAGIGFGLHDGTFRHPCGLIFLSAEAFDVSNEQWPDQVNLIKLQIESMETKKKEDQNLAIDGKEPCSYLRKQIEEVLSNIPETKNNSVKEIISKFSTELLIELENLESALGQK